MANLGFRYTLPEDDTFFPTILRDIACDASHFLLAVAEHRELNAVWTELLNSWGSEGE